MARRVIRQYEFIRKIGSGGSGVVFLANDTLLQRPVVLKLLKRGAQTAEQVRATQLREARLASAIDHPNVCAIYEVGEEDEEAYNGRAILYAGDEVLEGDYWDNYPAGTYSDEVVADAIRKDREQRSV